MAPGFGPEQRQLYTDLFRVMTVTQVLFAGSMALGEWLSVQSARELYQRLTTEPAPQPLTRRS